MTESAVDATADYSERVRALFAALRHSGRAEGPVVDVARGGMRIELSASLRGEHLGTLRFRAFACPHLLAALEAFCDEFEGRLAADLREYRAAATLEKLAIPVAKTGRLLLLEDAICALQDRIEALAKTD